MSTDRLAAALREHFAPTDLATLHGLLVDQLDDDAPQDDPLGRLCDAVYVAAHQPA